MYLPYLEAGIKRGEQRLLAAGCVLGSLALFYGACLGTSLSVNSVLGGLVSLFLLLCGVLAAINSAQRQSPLVISPEGIRRHVFALPRPVDYFIAWSELRYFYVKVTESRGSQTRRLHLRTHSREEDYVLRLDDTGLSGNDILTALATYAAIHGFYDLGVDNPQPPAWFT